MQDTTTDTTESTEHDDMLLNMLKECKTLPVFLNNVFGFLHRRTDFYLVTTDPDSPVGLPDGLAEYLVRHSYLKWVPKNKDEATILQECEVPEAVAEEEVVMTEEVTTEDLEDCMENLNIDERSYDDQYTESAQPIDSELKLNTSFVKSEYYNGAKYDSYCWSQTIREIDINIELPLSISCKDLKVSVLTQKISVKMRDTVLLEGELCQKCKHNEVIWSLDKQKLQIHLDKCKEMWWDCLVTSENRMDISKLDCSRPFEDLPDEAQAKIEQLGWNQQRKRLGLPSSDELAKQKVLRKAWNAEGSPFSGPFDPDQVIFD